MSSQVSGKTGMLIVQNENANSTNKMTFANYVNQQSRQFGKEISNLSSKQPDNFEQQLYAIQSQQLKIKEVKNSSNPQQRHIGTLSISQSRTTIHTNRNNSISQDYHQKKQRPITRQDTQMQEENINGSFRESFTRAIEIEKPQVKEILIPENVNLYVNEIFEYLRSEEANYLPNKSYMNSQKDITSPMRSILIDWLVDVHVKFKLIPETLFLTVNLIDRYLTKNQIMRTKLQLVGVAAMFIACKYEEIYAPDIKDFVYVCDKAYTKEEILDMESKILQCIEFSLAQTSALRFLERQVTGANISDKVSWASKMILELSLVEIRCLKFSPSLIATTAILFAINLLDSPQVLPSSLHYHQNPEELKQCIQELIILIQNLNKGSLSAIKRKYSSERYGKMSETICNIINQQK